MCPLIAIFVFNPHSGQVVASLEKVLYDDYLSLVASNKQQIQWQEIKKLMGHWYTGNYLEGANSSKHEVIGTTEARVACSFVFTRPFSN